MHLLSALAVMICAGPSPAQDAAPVRINTAGDERLLLQEIPSVFGASKYEQKVIEAPSAISACPRASIILFNKQYGDPVSADLVQNILFLNGRSYRLKLVYAF